jgi:uncharacterized RDD family membrane protein YckC
VSEWPTAEVAAGPRAGFGSRFAAYLIDAIVLGVLYVIALIVVGRGPAYAIDLLAGFAYFWYFEGSPSGQTPGKRVLGIRVYDFGSGSPNGIGFGRGIIRFLGKYISAIPCLLGFLWMLWDKEKQTWHDKIASTVVVPESRYPVESWPG